MVQLLPTSIVHRVCATLCVQGEQHHQVHPFVSAVRGLTLLSGTDFAQLGRGRPRSQSVRAKTRDASTAPTQVCSPSPVCHELTSSSSAQKRRVPSSTLPSSLPTATVSPQTPSNPLSSLVASLLHPLVHPREATEYNSYIDQFSQLSLSQDLSEKDEILYRASALIGTGEGGLQVDVGSRGLYDEVVALAGGGRA